MLRGQTAQSPRLAELEAIVIAGMDNFVKVGTALAEIRDQQLYRATHDSFAAYVEARFGIKVRRAYQLIHAAAAAENVQSSAHVTPNAYQAEQLSRLPANQQAAAWVDVVATNPNPTAADVAEHVAKRQPRKKRRAPKPIRVRVPAGIVIIERRAADIDPATLLHQAIEKLASQKAAA